MGILGSHGGGGDDRIREVLPQTGHAARPIRIIGLFCLLSRKFSFYGYVWIRTCLRAAREMRALTEHRRRGRIRRSVPPSAEPLMPRPLDSHVCAGALPLRLWERACLHASARAFSIRLTYLCAVIARLDRA